MNFDLLCAGCMREKPFADGPCPYCGFDRAKDDKVRPVYILPPFSVIGKRYLAGRCTAQTDSSLTYIGYDLHTGHTVELTEFFPRMHVCRDVRHTAAPSLIPGHTSMFAEQRTWFRNSSNAALIHDNQTDYRVRILQTAPAAQAPLPVTAPKPKAQKPKKKHRFVLLLVLAALAVCICVGIVIALQAFRQSDNVYVETDVASSILYADRTMFTICERTPVRFTVRTTDPTAESFDLYNGDTYVATLMPTETQGDTRWFEATLEVEEKMPMMEIYTARSGSEESTALTLRFAPEVTDEMIETAYAVLDDLNALESQEFPDGDPDETFLNTVYAWLRTDERVKAAVLEETCVRFITLDGISCMYSLPPGEGVFGSGTAAADEPDAQLTAQSASSPEYVFSQPDISSMQLKGDLVSVIESAGSIQDARFSDVYVRNDYSPTSTDVLFLQSFEGITSFLVSEEIQQILDPLNLTAKNFQENFCQKITDLVGGDFDTKRDVDFLSSLFDGSWSDYGTIVMNTHGLETPGRHASDGSVSTVFLIADNRNYEDYADWYAKKQYLFADYLNEYEENQYDSDFRTAPMTLNQYGELWATTDLIIDQYADKCFDNTVFVFNVCYMLRDKTFCSFLFSHGAQVIVGSPYSIGQLDSVSWINHLGEVWTDPDAHGDFSSYLSEGLENDAHTFSEDVLTVLMRRQKDGHSTYVYRGRGEIYGTVTYRGAPVEGAAITAYQYINHVLIPVTDNRFPDNEIVVMRTNRNGKFFMPDDLKSQKRRWGTYVVRIDYQGEMYYAQVNFHGTDGFGSVDIGNKLTPVATPVPTPKAEQTPTPTPVPTASPTPVPDSRAMLETYLRQVLIPEHGLMPTEQRALSGSALLNSDAFSGILSAEITDLDRDGADEMLVYRFTDDASFGSIIHLEIYEADEAIYLADALHFTESCFKSEYHDVRSALFLCDAGTYTGITLYTNLYMNSSHEVIRQFRYDGTALVSVICQGMATGGGPRGTALYKLTGSEQLRGDDPSAYPQLGYGSFGNYKGYETLVLISEEDYADSAGFAEADHNLLVQYADTLRPYGMQRNGQRIWVDELYDAQQSQKYSVQDLFSNSGSITWVAELDTCYEFSYRTAQKVVVAIDYADLAH